MRNLYLAGLVLAAIIVRRSLGNLVFGPVKGSGAVVSQSIPADFPSDVPMPPDAKCEEASKIAGVYQVELTVRQPVLSVVHFYEGELANQGWQVERVSDEMKEEEDEQGVVASKNGHMFAASISPLKDGSSEVRLSIR